VNEIRASTDDFPSTAPGGTVAHPATGSATRPDDAASDPEPAEQTPALDGREATAGQQPPAVESTPGELDTFSPSEAIEADQGVDFPYDI